MIICVHECKIFHAYAIEPSEKIAFHAYGEADKNMFIVVRICYTTATNKSKRGLKQDKSTLWIKTKVCLFDRTMALLALHPRAK